MKKIFQAVIAILATSAIAQPGPKINGNQINPQTAISISTLSVTGNSGVTVTSTATVKGNAFSVGLSTFVVKSGRVGIGTSSPDETLHVAGTSMLLDANSFGTGATLNLNAFSASNPAIVLKQAGTVRGHFFYDTSQSLVTVNADGASSAGVTVNSSNNVGIGMTAPSTARLRVEGPVLFAGTSLPGTVVNGVQIATGTWGEPQTSGSAANGLLRIGNAAVSDLVIDVGVQAQTGPVYTWIQSRQDNGYNTNNNLAINPNGGNVGIGTTTPTAMLHVKNTGSRPAFLARQETNGEDILSLTGRNVAGVSNGLFLRAGTNSSDYAVNVEDAGGAGTLFKVRGDGSVGIGTGSPAAKLEVSGSVAKIRATASGTQPGFELYSPFNNSSERNWELLTSYNAIGDFGIRVSASSGTAPGSERLYIDTSGNTHLKTSAGTQLFYCDAGASVGNLCRGNGCSCSGGTWIGMPLYVP